MFIIDDRAKEDLRDAFQWYEKREPGLGDRFLASFDDARRRIENRPGMHPKALGDARFVMMRPFPYVVYFRTEQENIVILAVVHAHRDPLTWQSRV